MAVLRGNELNIGGLYYTRVHSLQSHFLCVFQMMLHHTSRPNQACPRYTWKEIDLYLRALPKAAGPWNSSGYTMTVKSPPTPVNISK